MKIILNKFCEVFVDINGFVKRINEQIDELNLKLKDDVYKSIVTEDLNYIKNGLDYIKYRLNSSISSLLDKNTLDFQSQQLNDIKINLESYAIKPLNNYISNIRTEIQNTLNVTNYFLPIKNTYNYTTEVSNFKSIITDKLSESNIELNKIKENENELKNKINEIESNYLQLNTVYQNTLNELNTSFQNTINNLNDKYKNSESEFKIKFEEVIENQKSLNIDFSTQYMHEINEGIEYLKNKLEEANKLLGLIGDKAVTGNFAKIADNHKKNANWLRGISFFLMILNICNVIYLSNIMIVEGIEWDKIFIKFLNSLVFLLPAIYFLNESAKHRKLEVYNRNAELELSAIKPFISSLSESERNKVKEKLV